MSLDPLIDQMLEKAFAELQEGSFEDAIDEFTNCISLEPTKAKAYQGRALASFKIKNWPAAVSDFKKAKELDSNDAENWIGLGMSLAMVNEIYPAIDILETLIKNSPNYTRAHIQLGSLYYKIGIIKKGHEQMDLALASRPSLAERRMIEQLKKEQLTLDKKRFYRPDFEELRRKNKASSGLIKQLIEYMKKFAGTKDEQKEMDKNK